MADERVRPVARSQGCAGMKPDCGSECADHQRGNTGRARPPGSRRLFDELWSEARTSAARRSSAASVSVHTMVGWPVTRSGVISKFAAATAVAQVHPLQSSRASCGQAEQPVLRYRIAVAAKVQYRPFPGPKYPISVRSRCRSPHQLLGIST